MKKRNLLDGVKHICICICKVWCHVLWHICDIHIDQKKRYQIIDSDNISSKCIVKQEVPQVSILNFVHLGYSIEDATKLTLIANSKSITDAERWFTANIFGLNINKTQKFLISNKHLQKREQLTSLLGFVMDSSITWRIFSIRRIKQIINENFQCFRNVYFPLLLWLGQTGWSTCDVYTCGLSICPREVFILLIFSDTSITSKN